MWRRVAAACVLCLASSAATGSAETSPPTCFDSPATIVGTAGNDTIQGTDGADVIVALDGDDAIYGHGGDDKICGGSGRDSIDAGPGNDQIDGGADGPDTAFYLNATGPI